ncbi:MAG: ferritin family protein [Phycisphaerales bacterium]|nr:MAG: ferritin family protein [Phycisphaerales bacterium]
MALDSVEEILDFAIVQEEKAAQFYTELAENMAHKHMKEALLGFANEEKGHKAKLLRVKEGEQMLPAEKKVLDLKVGDYLEDATPSSNIDYRDALILAMKAEKAAFRLYSDLASATDDPNLRSVLLGLAQEEAKHKLRFELEYDAEFLKEN